MAKSQKRIANCTWRAKTFFWACYSPLNLCYSPHRQDVICPSHVCHSPHSSILLRDCFGACSVLVRSFFGCSSVKLRFLYKRRITEEQPKKQRICPEAGTKQVRSGIEETICNNFIVRFLAFEIVAVWQNWMLLEVKKSFHRAHEGRLFPEKW
jgi:hypothetical protein